jgi:hypothetical protein
MILRTTLNIHVDILSRIYTAAIKLNKSHREIIILLFMRIMQNHSLLQGKFTTVKYQPDDERNKWHKFHICFKPDENEFFGDLRKFCKFSVSYLLAIAVREYLDELMGDAEKKSVDNYPYFNNYMIYREIVSGIISWRLYWGYPAEEAKTFRL